MLYWRVAEDGSAEVSREHNPVHAVSIKGTEPNPRTIVSGGLHLTKRPIMYRRVDPLISASRGTLAGSAGFTPSASANFAMISSLDSSRPFPAC